MADSRLSKNPKLVGDSQPAFSNPIIAAFTKHKDLLTYFMAGIVVIASISVLMNFNKQTKEKEASSKLYSAMTAFQRDLTVAPETPESEDPESAAQKTELPKSPGLLTEIIDNYPGTVSGTNAAFLKGFSLNNAGQPEQALEAFTKFYEANPDHPLAANCLLGKASVQFNFNNVDESLATLNSIEKKYPEFLLKDILYYEMGKRYEALNYPDKAITQYKKVVEDYPDSSWKTLSEKRLKELDSAESEDKA